MPTSKQISRNERTITLLERQLKSGVKRLTNKMTKELGMETAPYTEGDIKRINKEIETLRKRI